MVYLLLSSFIFTNADLIQIFRIPNLCEHFSEHNKLGTSISFTDFLQDHYFNMNHDDHDTDKDNALPFKSSLVQVFNLLNLQIPPTFSKIKLPFVVQTASQKVCNALDDFYFYNYLSANWNPPRFIA